MTSSSITNRSNAPLSIDKPSLALATKPRLTKFLIVLWLLIQISVAAAGYWIYQDRRETALKELLEEINAMADLKTDETTLWLRERKRDAATLYHSRLGAYLQPNLTAGASPRLQEDTVNWLTQLCMDYGYAGIVLLDDSGKILLTIPATGSSEFILKKRARSFISQALQSHQVFFNSIYGSDPPYLDLVVPLLGEDRQATAPLGALLLRVDPRTSLFPLIQRWPTPNTTAEVLLVRREGDQVVLLNILDHSVEANLSAHFPLDTPGLVSAIAARGEADEVNNPMKPLRLMDFRGKRVLATIRAIPDSPLYLIAKIDWNEVNARVWQHGLNIAVNTMLLMLLTSILLWISCRTQRDGLLNQANRALETLVEERTTALKDANTRLKEEMAQRECILEQQQQHQIFLQAVLDNIQDGIVACNAEGRLTLFNQAARHFHNLSDPSEEPVGPENWASRYDLYLADGQTPMPIEDIPLYRALHGKIVRDVEMVIDPKTGSRRTVRANGQQLADKGGRLLGAVVSMHDITEQRRQQAMLEYQATHDALTGLPNRYLLWDRLAHALTQAERLGHNLAVLFIDLDRFKTVNDGLGHAVGDALLQATAARLKASTRKSDTVARYGGDEFIVVLEGLDEGEAAAGAIAAKILDAFATHFTVEGHEIFVGTSIGVSLYPRDGRDANSLVKGADQALHQAKGNGRNEIQFYDPAMNAQRTDRLKMERHLRRALEHEAFELHYQPQVDLASGRVIGVEALLRWHDPTLGRVSPEEFIPLAEETGLIVPIGAWVLKTACAQACAWQAAKLQPLRVAVNLSARQFQQPQLIDFVAGVIQETGLNPCYLELEITESMLMQNMESAINTLMALERMGVQLTVDDFGTGYSSLNYLKRFPINRLKIDKSFVLDITKEPDDAAIAQTIIAMAHSLRFSVIAEGVETEAQLAFLRKKHCDEIQGYYFSPPLPAPKITALLQEKRSLRLDNASSERQIVLLVEDDPLVLETISLLLTELGYEVLGATDGHRGLDLIARYPIGVVLADHGMPGMTGTEFLRRVRMLYPEVVRIVLSGGNDFTMLIRSINEAAVYRFLMKPVSEEDLRESLQEAFLIHRTRNQRAQELCP